MSKVSQSWWPKLPPTIKYKYITIIMRKRKRKIGKQDDEFCFSIKKPFYFCFWKCNQNCLGLLSLLINFQLVNRCEFWRFSSFGYRIWFEYCFKLISFPLFPSQTSFCELFKHLLKIWSFFNLKNSINKENIDSKSNLWKKKVNRTYVFFFFILFDNRTVSRSKKIFWLNYIYILFYSWNTFRIHFHLNCHLCFPIVSVNDFC